MFAPRASFRPSVSVLVRARAAVAFWVAVPGLILAVLLPAGAVAGCGLGGPGGDGPEGPAGRDATSEEAPMTEIDRDTVDRLVEAGNAFAFDLYGALAEPVDSGGENLFFSPYSVSAALAMTRAGARGATAEEMTRALHLDADAAELRGERLHAAAEGLRDRIEPQSGSGGAGDEDSPLTLRVANALWGQEGVAFAGDFRTLLAERYGARLERVDFVGAAEEARQTINRWVEGATEGKIRNLVQPGAVDSLTRLVLTNAVYFQGSWKHPFDADRTTEQPFHRLEGDPVQVPLMAQTESFPYAARGSYAAVELPYGGSSSSEAAMLVVVPDRGAFARVEGSFDAAELEALTGALSTTRVELGLPRFEIASAAALSEPLKALGMGLAFSDRADFSGMVDPEKEPEVARELHLDQVLHEAWVRVDEEGTEAAAATGAMMAVTSMPVGEPVRLIVDRPFLVFLRHRPTGAILFAGRVLDPTA